MASKICSIATYRLFSELFWNKSAFLWTTELYLFSKHDQTVLKNIIFHKLQLLHRGYWRSWRSLQKFCNCVRKRRGKDHKSLDSRKNSSTLWVTLPPRCAWKNTKGTKLPTVCSKEKNGNKSSANSWQPQFCFREQFERSCFQLGPFFEPLLYFFACGCPRVLPHCGWLSQTCCGRQLMMIFVYILHNATCPGCWCAGGQRTSNAPKSDILSTPPWGDQQKACHNSKSPKKWIVN